MIVITLTKVPQSLRGDLTKWYQEVQTGVYVGTVSARIRDLLWERVMKNIGSGEATMVYNTNNEIGYQIKTTRKNYEVVDFDGVPLMKRLNTAPGPVKHGFSNAAKFHRAKVMSRVNHKSKEKKAAKTAIAQVVSVDIETTGLSVGEDEIISIAAVKKLESGENDHFYKLVQIDHEVPKKITELTGISSGMLKEQGVELALVLNGLQEFIKNSVIIGYNLRFDEEFLTYNLKKVNQKPFSNNTVDLMPVVKKADQFLDNYRLGTVLKEYEIENLTPHNALSDAKATLELAEKLMKNGHLKI